MNTKKSGFTLIELLCVIAMIVIIASLVCLGVFLWTKAHIGPAAKRATSTVVQTVKDYGDNDPAKAETYYVNAYIESADRLTIALSQKDSPTYKRFARNGKLEEAEKLTEQASQIAVKLKALSLTVEAEKSGK